jgi:hypothetical protein
VLEYFRPDEIARGSLTKWYSENVLQRREALAMMEIT